MSMPNIPNINPTVSIDRNDAVNLILSSIGMEELSMAHILNAEGEKIQFALGTLETANGEAASLSDIMDVNKSANRMLRDVIKNQMLIGMKMEEVVELANDAEVKEEATEEVTKEEVVTEESAKEEVVTEEPTTEEEEPIAEENAA